MNNFQVSFCDPFQSGITGYGEKSRIEVIPLYHTIPWLQLNEAIYTRHDEVVNDFWFLEVSYQDLDGLKHTLNLSPEYVTGSGLGREDLRFTLRYIRPRMRKRLFGGEKLDKHYMTEREDNNEEQTLNCLISFMDLDVVFLERYLEA